MAYNPVASDVGGQVGRWPTGITSGPRHSSDHFGDHCHSVNPHARRDEHIKVTTAFHLSLRDSGELG